MQKNFPPDSTGNATGVQLQLPMLTHYDGPRLLPMHLVAGVSGFRGAVRLCWEQRIRPRMTQAQLAEEAGLYCSHVSDYLSADPTRRDLPAHCIQAVEVACGNRAITQWMVLQAQLTIAEQDDAPREAAA